MLLGSPLRSFTSASATARLSAGKVCFGSKCRDADLLKGILESFAMVLEASRDAVPISDFLSVNGSLDQGRLDPYPW